MGDTGISERSPDDSCDFSCSSANNSNFSHSGKPELKLLSLNVCGLASKSQIPEFVELINRYDIIGIQESKTDDCDDINIPRYSIVYNNRRKLSRTKSGGIALLIKSEIRKYIKVEIKNESKIIQWFTIAPDISPTGNPINCGVVYIPPYGSKYAHEDPYAELQREILRYCNNSEFILFGDFNSRTGEKNDFQEIDSFISEMHGLESIRDETLQVLDYFTKCNVALHRSNSDKQTNHYGNQMLEFCKTVDVFILNGRINDCTNSSKFTCKDKSTVDYFLSTSNLFPKMNKLEILEFSSLYSDVHCPIALSIQSQSVDTDPSHKHHIENSKTRLWNDNNKSKFQENLDLSSVTEILTKLNECWQSDDITQSELDGVVAEIGNLFEKNALKTFGSTVPKHDLNSLTREKKLWFNSECRRSRNQYHYARKFYNRYKSQESKNYLKRISKQYKQTIARNIRSFNQNRIEKLRKLKSSDSKEYWKILNPKTENKDSKASLNDLFNYFKDINSQDNSQTYTDINNNNISELNEEINRPISESEILKAVKQLKNNKSSGIDNIKNEHIKSTINIMLPIYTKLFNLVFNSGKIPESWTLGVIKPIYKNKGDPKLPENYRPITILSCLGKLFTLIIDNRLKFFTEKYNIIEENQAGFRKNHSTVDNLFIIKSLIDIAKSSKNKLFCCFIDFKQAFDTVWRQGLWYKLKEYNINGKCFNIIKNMYENIKSKVATNNESSAFFPCLTGVRQGENLSPILFSLYLDLNHYLMSHNVTGINCEVASDDIYMYLKILILLYADDTVLFSNTASDLQCSLNNFRLYCETWKLTVNISKTKIVIFSSGRRRPCRFYFGNDTIEITKEYKYLGINLTQSGSFIQAKKTIAEQGNKALFSLLKKSRSLNLPHDIQLELFDRLVKPILLYGAEVWGYGNCDIIERVHLKFLKYVFNLKKSTPSYMIYGELGILPITVDINFRLINFWCKIIDNLLNDNMGQQKLSTLTYTLLYHK